MTIAEVFLNLDHYVTHSPSDTLYKPVSPKHLALSNAHRFQKVIPSLPHTGSNCSVQIVAHSLEKKNNE